MLGSLVQILLGGFTSKIRRIFPPIVQGIVVSYGLLPSDLTALTQSL